MEKRVIKALLVLIILSCVLVALIIWDHSNSSGEGNQTVSGEEQADPTLPDETETPSVSPTVSPTEIPTPTPVPSPVPTITPTPIPAEETSAEGDISPDEIENNTEEEQETEDEQENVTYKALYEQEGKEYTLIADSITGCFLVINHNNDTVRQTEYTYDPEYAQLTQSVPGPILCYMNNHFIFITENHLVASDGEEEVILQTLREEDHADAIHINQLQKSENRIMAGLASKDLLLVIDCRTLEVEKYMISHTVDFLVFTDEYLCFSEKKKIPEGPSYTYLYTARNGKTNLLGSIPAIEACSLENNKVTITGQGESYQIDLQTDELTSSASIGKERTLYFPVYGDGIISALSEIRFVNKNEDNKPVQSIQLPDILEAECYYNTYYEMSIYSLHMKDSNKAKRLPDKFGSFWEIDYSVFPLKDSKFLVNSTVKETLYSGKTFLGEGEIFLLEKKENINDIIIPFEMIYAWIPISGENRAYQIYIYVPMEEETGPYLNMMLQLLGMG